MDTNFTIAEKTIGIGQPPYLIAEVSANHLGNLNRAIELIRKAKDSGADAVKLQTYTADTITIDHKGDDFTIKSGLWKGRTLYDLYQEAHTPWEWQPRLKYEANRLGMDLFSSPFDPTAVDFLEDMGVPAYKVASFEIVDISLLKKIASTGKPVVVSIGMAELSEIDDAVKTLRENGCPGLALLKCTSSYPAPMEEANLRTIPNLADTFGLPTGLSDHTLGIEVPIAAVALGACIIEKHFTLSRNDGGPDSAFSLEPAEFKAMADAVRNVQKALGEICYGLTEEQRSSRIFRRSLYVVRDIRKGDMFTKENVRSIRPGKGLHPRFLESVIGSISVTNINRGTPLSIKHLIPKK